MRFRASAGLLRRVMNLWPPFRGAGIRVASIASDWSHVRVELRLKRLNRNFVGTHFGGSLFAMTDPFYMIMLLQQLGDDYLVWDQAAEIEYVKPGRGTVHAEFRLDPHHVQRLRQEAADGSKLLPEYLIEVCDAQGDVVARVRKKLYVRLKKDRRPTGSAA
jgi:acyl-coenzyme A thioesterase PaaI-like protein